MNYAKTGIVILISIFSYVSGIAQANSTGNRIVIPERTAELEALFKESNDLEKNGTAEQINANRLAIKNAWQEIDPKVAALYKPLPPVADTPELVERPIHPRVVQANSRSSDGEWGSNLLVHEGFVDAMDMDVTGAGDMYIISVEQFVGSTSNDSEVFVYRSQDDGESFELWKSIMSFDTQVLKVQAIVIDGVGSSYLLAYILTDNGIFMAGRWELSSGDYDFEIIASDVTDFSVDKGFSLYTASHRVYGLYLKDMGETTTELFSARSTAGSYGFGWTDQADMGWYTSELDMAYGTSGGCFAAFIGGINPSLYSATNPNSNDPTSWSEDYEQVESHTVSEITSPTIAAARISIPWEKIMIIASTRNAGSTDNFGGQIFRREGSATFETDGFIDGTASLPNIVQPSTYVRGDDNIETFHTSFAQVSDEATVNNKVIYKQYEENENYNLEAVSDAGVNVFPGYPAALGETSENLPCMAFAGYDGFEYGWNLYFDKKTLSVGVDENLQESFTFYPNPARETLTLSAKSAVESVAVYSQLGQQVLHLAPQTQKPTLDVSLLAPGLYTMKVKVNGRTAAYQIVKE